ncbi:phage terminase large subunit [Roseovarius aestuariivivens]|uniref:phage terminase large subunit n=1 Tax=Roseovarius aestuariivivens TaxID=1888910 RepID=UPI001FD8B19F|nr:phage terminase large subunit [Roseovarius aestuariivivens]
MQAKAIKTITRASLTQMTEIDRVDLFRALLRQDLSSFIQRAFRTVDPGAPYQHGWHVDAIARQLERIASGDIRRLIITMPPRSMKSIAASVAFPAYLLGHDPSQQIVAVSYSDVLAEKLALDCLKVIEAPWYRSTFPATRLAKGRTRRVDFATTRGGGRFSTSIGGTLTGRGGNIILIDDPHKPEDATSEVKRKAVLEWFKSTLLSRQNDPATSAIVLIQQRVHEEDLAGTLIESGGWVHLDLPAIAEDHQVIDLGRRGKFIREPGHLLHPSRLSHAVLDERKAELGSYLFAAQYQQRPAPLGGGLIKWDWFKNYSAQPAPASGDRIIQSWDTASKADEANDWSVCTTWRVRGRHAWLLDVHRDRLEFPELRRRIPALADQWQAKLILLEEAGSGIQLLQDLRQSGGYSVRGLLPKDDKATRLLAVSHVIEGGQIAVPRDAPWLAEFQREVSLFPNGKYDDQVDSLSQFLRWFSEPRLTPRIRAL